MFRVISDVWPETVNHTAVKFVWTENDIRGLHERSEREEDRRDRPVGEVSFEESKLLCVCVLPCT